MGRLTYFDLIAWLLPLSTALFILVKFGKDDVAKYVGYLSLKPIFSLLLMFFEAKADLFDELNAHYSYEIVGSLLWIIPELLLTLVIVYFFRHLFNKFRLAWWFLIGDITRWLSVFISELIPDPVIEPYFYTQLYIWAFFVVVFPSLYAISGFIAVRKHTNSQNMAY